MINEFSSVAKKYAAMLLRRLSQNPPAKAVKLVLIEWEDSCQPLPEWRHLSDLPAKTAIQCCSVGWLISEENRVKMLAPNMGDIQSDANMQASGIIRIPEAAIIRIVELKEGGEVYFLRLPLASS